MGVDRDRQIEGFLAGLPCYARFGDLTIIGTEHFMDCRADIPKTKRFLEELQGIEHLILEGYGRSYLKPANPFGYEFLAYTQRPASTRFIEDGEDFIEANGIRKDLFGLYMMCLGVPDMWNKSSSPEELQKNIEGRARALDKVYHHIDENTALHQFVTVFADHNDPNILAVLGDRWAYGSSRNRDHYIFGPKTARWKEELEGKKVEVVGYAHFKFLDQYLTEGVNPPGHWRDILDPEHKAIAEDIELRLFPG